MAGSDKLKQSLYFPDDMLDEIMKEAVRLDRSLSWIVQAAWRVAASKVAQFPAAATARDYASRPAAAPAAAAPAPAAAAGAPVDRQPSDQVRSFLAGKFEKL